MKVNVTYKDATSNNGKVTAQSIDANKTVDEGTTITITVNQVAEDREVTVNVAVKKLVEIYFEAQSEEENINRNVNVKVNNETRTVNSSADNCEIKLSGKEGQSLTINVSITDGSTVIYSSSQTITVGSQNTVTFNS